MSQSARRDFLNPLKAIRAFREQADTTPVSTPSPAIIDDRDLDEDSLLYVSRPAMACTFQIYFAPGVGDDTTEIAIEALDLLEQLENQMTVYRESPLTYINQVAAEEPIRVEANLFRLIQTGLELYEKTGGAFDLTSGLLTKAWGFFRKEGRVPAADELQAILANVGSHRIVVDPVAETVFYQAPQLEINLGGIGKGHALDRIADFMQQAGLENYLIHGGQSSVLARGMRWQATAVGETPPAATSNSAERPAKTLASEPWKVGLRHPLHADRRIAVLHLNHQALGTSGTARQSFYHRGKRYGHIIDPRSGQPAAGVHSATALAPTAAEADALATAFYVMGGPAATEFCQRHPEYACLVLSPGRSGQVQIHSEGIPDDRIEWLD